MGQIFVSYRRKNWSFAHRLAEHLEARLPSANVFIDIENVHENFALNTLKAVRDCDIFLLVLSDMTFEQGRIENSEDWIRQEVVEAFNYKREKIILVSENEIIFPATLPSDLAWIKNKPSVVFYPQYYDTGIHMLMDLCRTFAPGVFEKPVERKASLVTVEQTGILHTYDNLDACQNDIKADFANAKDIRLLLQLGRRELGGGSASYFYNAARDKGAMPDHSIRVLFASAASPFLSEERAVLRGGSDYLEWQTALLELETKIQFLREKRSINITARRHSEPFLWRIFLFDNLAYVSGYLFSEKNDQFAVVHKIEKGRNSLFGVFEKYFEYLWEKYLPDETRTPNEKWKYW